MRTPTWTDYLRLNHRLTEADKQLDERILLLHAGELPPQAAPLIERRHARPANPSSRYITISATELRTVREAYISQKAHVR
ncbi:MAG: hypothetical protein EOR72_25720 [Mesorhizobium sp.]|nr:MAG: hypothetical protein EOR72_25720 [Mesorhizobium sp.]